MKHAGRIFVVPLFLLTTPLLDAAEDPSVVLDGRRPDDARLAPDRVYGDEYHPWTPPESLSAWQTEAEAIRKQILVSNGLWPMPPKPSLEPVIHGKIDRGDYTVEKVFFTSHPGYYVTGNLYRPANRTGKLAGVLCPHGHWPDGRFHDAGPEQARQQIDIGAEKYMAGARIPIQARLVQLARMGCVVFHYDMVGYADNQPIAHRGEFNDVEAALRLQNKMGLQTFNSIRALDFLLSLPEVDRHRIGVTGASGGGTQTFMLCAVDPRPAVAFPAVMVSTGMQGGCVCENASYLRHGINNVAFAALFAPKPMALSGADDWTLEIETKGLPELKHIYSLYGESDRIAAEAFPQFKHNYNCVAREMMYNWFNEHLGLGEDTPVVESDFWPVIPEDLSVFNEEHPRPDDVRTAGELRDYLTDTAREQFASLLPEGAGDVAEYRRIVGTAARIMLDEGLPESNDVESSYTTTDDDGLKLMKGVIARRGSGEEIPFIALVPEPFDGRVVFWLDGAGKKHLFDGRGEPTPAVRKLLDSGRAVASADVFLTGEFLAGDSDFERTINENYPGYTFCYNRPLLANRVRDGLTMLSGIVNHPRVERVELIGTGEAGPWALLAAALGREALEEAVVDVRGASLGSVEDASDPLFLPGALKYGGLGGLAALASPLPLKVAGLEDLPEAERSPLQQVYRIQNARLTLLDGPLTPEAAADALEN